MNKILLVGCGHMGQALLRTWLSKTNYSFSIIDPLKYKLINNKFKKINAFKSLKEIKNLTSFDIVILAVKPQIANIVLADFKFLKFKNKILFVSIIAGKKINFFKKFLPKNHQFIRIMPNMPAMIGEGMSALVKSKNVSLTNKNKIETLFSKVGKTLWLKNESEIDKVTAISGSGPGYIFLLIDAFEKAALQLGLNKKITNNLVHQTFFGSIKLLLLEKKNADVLVDQIAVKGGTTEAGLSVFKNKQIIKKIFNNDIKNAYNKAKKLGK